MITLRPYQQKLIDDILTAMSQGGRAVCAVLGCGGGKSVIMAHLARNFERVLFLVHRKELCTQIEKTFSDVGATADIMMVQTMSRRLNKYFGHEYDLIITDECHHSTAKTYTKIYDKFTYARKVGFTATPFRLNGGGLGDVYDTMIQSVSTKWMIDNGFLSHYKYYSVQLADVAGLHTVRGDYKPQEVASLMENDTIYGDTVKQWERLARGKKTIVYCVSVEASSKTAEEFSKAGYSAASLDGSTPKETRNTIMESFRGNGCDILCNCELFGEGIDIPDCECTVLLRPTQSLSLFTQQSMRSMRYKPGKTAIIIDHVGNVYRHGLPDDKREWTLESKRKQENTVKIRECKNCFAVYPPNLPRCPYCGQEATHEVRTENKKTVDVDLKEVKRVNEIKNTRLNDAVLSTWEEIVEFQRIHKYKFLWCLRYAESHGIKYPGKYNFMRRFIK